MSQILISEIFGPTIQGEGQLIGTPTVFVRTAGCDFHCSWCDTLYAVEKSNRNQWHKMHTQQVLDRVINLSDANPLLITLSGGNPALQPLGDLIDQGHDLGYRFALETQGSVVQDWFSKLDVLTLSPKPPSSKMSFDPDKLQACIDAASQSSSVNLKIVIENNADLAWAWKRHQVHPDIPLILQPCNTTSGKTVVDIEALNDRMRWLIGEVNRHHWNNLRVLPQLHVQLWGNQRGV